ncbi:hypothetical protein F5B22DRAFT_619514 [Xylaria bambusicola]|uniref:uncharacterized protein n=1 Tax=Xylaria bambusicola TaxID=326684 RepID=UPI002007ED26|nr:uncharacterized protein F5B22DRAFT_619514 [Xylaria bambusicola]KAI0508766.1 hypothetical protein F5B22DRAFT_619514 [Xylaria bambusicola]
MSQGTLSFVLRFICHLPFAYFAVNSVIQFNFVKDHKGILLAPPLSTRVLVGETFAGPVGVIGFVWNFLLWIPTIFFEDRALALIGVVDAIITGFVLIPLALEATYISFTPAQCAHLSLDTIPSPHLILFQRIADIKAGDDTTGEETCQGYYAKWYAGLIVVILYAVSATANILIGSRSQRMGGSPPTYPRDRRFDKSNWLLSAVPPIRHITRESIQNNAFFASRYIQHWVSHIIFATKRRLPDSHSLVPRLAHHSSDQEKGLLLLLSHNVVEKIVQHLHYVDIVNLSLTSKKNHEALFPRRNSDFATEKKQLRYYSCWGMVKADCWACGIQLCNGCSGSRMAPSSTVSFHISFCAATCSRCYYKSILDPFSHGALFDTKLPCQCYDGRTKGFVNSFGALPNHPHARRLCRDCCIKKPDDILALRERRDQVMYSKLTQQPLSCFKCCKSLPRTGPRWWLCFACKRECRGGCHLGWAEDLEKM